MNMLLHLLHAAIIIASVHTFGTTIIELRSSGYSTQPTKEISAPEPKPVVTSGYESKPTPEIAYPSNPEPYPSTPDPYPSIPEPEISYPSQPNTYEQSIVEENSIGNGYGPAIITEKRPNTKYVAECREDGCCDGHRLCKWWSEREECNLNFDWMRENCQLSCSNCPQDIPIEVTGNKSESTTYNTPETATQYGQDRLTEAEIEENLPDFSGQFPTLPEHDLEYFDEEDVLPTVYLQQKKQPVMHIKMLPTPHFLPNFRQDPISYFAPQSYQEVVVVSPAEPAEYIPSPVQEIAQPQPQAIIDQPQPYGIIEKPQPYGIIEKPQTRGIIEKPQPYGIIGKPQPYGIFEKPQPYRIIEKSQPYGIIEHPYEPAEERIYEPAPSPLIREPLVFEQKLPPPTIQQPFVPYEPSPLIREPLVFEQKLPPPTIQQPFVPYEPSYTVEEVSQVHYPQPQPQEPLYIRSPPETIYIERPVPVPFPVEVPVPIPQPYLVAVREPGTSSNQTVIVQPGDCVMGSWSAWTGCSRSCGEGEQSRSRSIDSQPDEDGRPCPDNMQVKKCIVSQCTGGENCEVSSWTRWTPCSTNCGAGVQLRTRQNGGARCPDLLEQKECLEPCQESGEDRDCLLTDWNEWSQCPPCGSGERFRLRNIRQPSLGNGISCPPVEDLQQIETCQFLEPCEEGGHDTMVPVEVPVKVPVIVRQPVVIRQHVFHKQVPTHNRKILNPQPSPYPFKARPIQSFQGGYQHSAPLPIIGGGLQGPILGGRLGKGKQQRCRGKACAPKKCRGLRKC